MAYAGYLMAHAGTLSKPSGFTGRHQGAVSRQMENGAVVADQGVVRFKPSEMDLNRYYCVELDGEPIVYRRVSEREVEIYGLAPD